LKERERERRKRERERGTRRHKELGGKRVEVVIGLGVGGGVVMKKK
jgi:hypothetical protein